MRQRHHVRAESRAYKLARKERQPAAQPYLLELRKEAECWKKPILKTTSAKKIFLADFERWRTFAVRLLPCLWGLQYASYEAEQRAKNAWDVLSDEEWLRYCKKAARNEELNAKKLATFNASIKLSPSVEDVPMFNDFESWGQLVTKQECLGLQRWNRYRRDHPEACGGAVTPVPVRPFRFLDLPFELRQEIYVLVLTRQKMIWQYPPDGSAADAEGPLDVRIFTVSKAIHEEAVPVFYRINVFAINLFNMPLFIKQSTGNKAPRPTDMLRHVHIGVVLYYDRYDKAARVIKYNNPRRTYWKKLFATLENCGSCLDVDFTLYYSDPSGEEGSVTYTRTSLVTVVEIFGHIGQVSDIDLHHHQEVMYIPIDYANIIPRPSARSVMRDSFALYELYSTVLWKVPTATLAAHGA